MDIGLCENLINLKWRICGYKLRPYSYNHVQALEAIKSPLISQDKPVSPAHLLLALRVCSTPADKVFDRLAGIRRTMRDRYHIYKMEIFKSAFHKALFNFVGYQSDYAQMPDRPDESGGRIAAGSRFDGPVYFGRLCNVLMAYKGSISESRARSMPLGLLLYYDEMSHYLKNGGAPFRDRDKELSELEELNRINAETGI